MKLRKLLTTILATTMVFGTVFTASANNVIVEADFSTLEAEPFAFGRDGGYDAETSGVKDGAFFVDRFFQGPNKGINMHFVDAGIPIEDNDGANPKGDGKDYKITIKGFIPDDQDIPEGSEMWIQMISDGNYYGDAHYAAAAVSNSNRTFDFSYTHNNGVDLYTSKAPRIRIRTNDAATDGTSAINYSITYISIEEVTEDTAPAAGDTTAATDTDKAGAKTGVADVAVITGLVVLAGGAIVVARKRK